MGLSCLFLVEFNSCYYKSVDSGVKYVQAQHQRKAYWNSNKHEALYINQIGNQIKWVKFSFDKSKIQKYCFKLAENFVWHILAHEYLDICNCDGYYVHQTILIPQVLNNETMVIYQTSTVDLHFRLMVAHYLMYFAFLCKLSFNSWKRSKSNLFIDKILHRLLFLFSKPKNDFCF